MSKILLSFLGAPGSGKGTQAKLLVSRENFLHIATGDLIREVIARKGTTDQEKAIAERYAKGIPQPDEVVTDMVLNKIRAAQTQEISGIILDPFPLSVGQIQSLETCIASGQGAITNSWLVDFQISEDESVKRLLLRQHTEKRQDDTESVIRFRYQEYMKRTATIIPFYKERNRYVPIDGSPAIEEIYAQFIATLRERNILAS